MRRLAAAAFLVATLLLSCTSGEEEPPLRIAFVQDLSAPDADEHVQSALQAAELAVAMQATEGAPVELVPFDLAEEPSAIDEIGSDPSFLAAIVGPGADGSAVAEAGVPTVSVSTAGPTPADGSWRRFVAPIDVLADVVAAALAGSEPCVLSEEPAPDGLAGLLTDRLGEPAATLDPAEAPSFVEASGCDAVAWAGSPDPGAELARALPDGIALVGGDRLLDPDFLDAGSAADGARAACSCVDLSTSTDPETMRFIQDYQSEYGLPPGPYAVEAWDAAHAVLLALQGSEPTRDDARDWLGQVTRFEGLAADYAFDPTGELVVPYAFARLSRVAGGRWLPFTAPS